MSNYKQRRAYKDKDRIVKSAFTYTYTDIFIALPNIKYPHASLSVNIFHIAHLVKNNSHLVLNIAHLDLNITHLVLNIAHLVLNIIHFVLNISHLACPKYFSHSFKY